MTLVDLEELPFLNAFLRESMRYHGPAVGRNFRVAPVGGTTVLGYHLPEDVKESSLALM
jgi:cytochrome P450